VPHALATRRDVIALIGGAAAALPTTTRAQDFPSRPVTLVVGFPPGGTADLTARIVADHMKASLGQSVIVENVPGSGGSIGAGRVAHAAADGYTLVCGSWGTHVVNGAILPLAYDVVNDFAPVSLLTDQPLVIATKAAVPAKDLRELIAWLKAAPVAASAGTAGAGGVTHLAEILFQSMTGTRLHLVPYRGSPPALQDLVAGRIDLFVTPAAAALPQIRAGAVKAFAVTASSRLTVAPDIPTVDEQGLREFHISLWSALWAPKGTPDEVIRRLDAAVIDALADAAVRARLAELGQEIFSRAQQTPEALAAFQKAEIARWWPIIRAAGIKTP
jgi:tripartite-type tricarboxylate transporter receptor subunit TctC